MPLEKIISGGQTGIDRAALDIAIELGISHGGFCPLGRRSEDGMIPLHYNLIEHDSIEYAERTHENVLCSNGTLILHSGIISNGTSLTKQFCIQEDKPMMIINILHNPKSSKLDFNRWLVKKSIQILNVAGPRDNKQGNYEIAREILHELLCFQKTK